MFLSLAALTKVLRAPPHNPRIGNKTIYKEIEYFFYLIIFVYLSQVLGHGPQHQSSQHLPVINLYPPLAHLDEDDGLDQPGVVTEAVEVGGHHPVLGRLLLYIITIIIIILLLLYYYITGEAGLMETTTVMCSRLGQRQQTWSRSLSLDPQNTISRVRIWE